MHRYRYTTGQCLRTLAYINDINMCSNFHSILYADDSELTMVNHDIRKLEHSANEEFLKISDCLKNNRLSLNSCKTSYILFNKKAHKELFTSSVDGKPLAQVDNVRYLGVILDNKLDWNKHISFSTGKLSSCAGILSKLKHFIPLKSLVIVYYSIVQRYLQYAVTRRRNAVWKCLRKLPVKQNDIIRIITNKPRFKTKLFPLYDQLNLLQIKNIYNRGGQAFHTKGQIWKNC